MGIRSNRFQIVFVGQEGVRRSDETALQIGGHGFHHIFLPKKAVPAAGSKVGNAQSGHAAQSLNLAPQFGLRPRIQNVEPKLAQRFQIRPRLKFIQDGQGVQFPHRGLCPRAFEGQMDLPVPHSQVIVR